VTTRFVLLSALVLLGGTACRKKAKYIDPDAESKVEGTGIESRDVRAVVAQMTGELLASGALKGDGPPRVAVTPVENRSRFLIDQDIFTTLITDQLIQHSKGQLAIVNRDLMDQILAERKMKSTGQVSDDGKLSALAGVDYFLEGEVRALSASTNRAQTDYVVVRFQLTDAESGIIGWSNSYEMKKEGKWGVMYQ
jgi:TolB-like protein